MNPTDHGKMICNAIDSNLEISNYARLHNYVFISVLRFFSSTVPIYDLKHCKTELCNSKFFPLDFSNIDFTKLSIKTCIFIFLSLNFFSLITSPQDSKIIKKKTEKMSNNQIVIKPSTYSIQVTVEFPVWSNTKI